MSEVSLGSGPHSLTFTSQRARQPSTRWSSSSTVGLSSFSASIWREHEYEQRAVSPVVTVRASMALVRILLLPRGSGSCCLLSTLLRDFSLVIGSRQLPWGCTIGLFCRPVSHCWAVGRYVHQANESFSLRIESSAEMDNSLGRLVRRTGGWFRIPAMDQEHGPGAGRGSQGTPSMLHAIGARLGTRTPCDGYDVLVARSLTHAVQDGRLPLICHRNPPKNATRPASGRIEAPRFSAHSRQVVICRAEPDQQSDRTITFCLFVLAVTDHAAVHARARHRDPGAQLRSFLRRLGSTGWMAGAGFRSAECRSPRGSAEI